MNGVVVKLITDKGFGFIQPEDGSKDLFFHARSVVGDVVYDELKEGDKVTFETEDGPKGPSAVDVEKTGEADAEPAADTESAA